jgi:glycosyl transferase family 2
MSSTVSVVAPSFNAARTLPACLAAIAAQRITPHEVLVVDDASTDDSAAIAAAAGATVIGQPVNRGVSAARNRGADESTGAVLFYVDADVALAPDAIGNALAILDAEPETGCVHGIYETTPLIDDGPLEHYKILSNHYWRRRSLGRVGTALFALGAIRREVLLRAGGFDEALRDGEDIELSIRLRPLCAITLTDTVTGRHDDADRWRAVLGEQFRRSRLLVPLARAERRGSRLKSDGSRAAAGDGSHLVPGAGSRAVPGDGSHPAPRDGSHPPSDGGHPEAYARHPAPGPAAHPAPGHPGPPDHPDAPTLTGQRPAAVAATALALGVLVLMPAAALFTGRWPVLAVPAVLALAAALLADPGLLAFVRRERGWGYLGFFLAAQAAVLVTLVAGAATGALSPAVARRPRTVTVPR